MLFFPVRRNVFLRKAFARKRGTLRTGAIKPSFANIEFYIYNLYSFPACGRVACLYTSYSLADSSGNNTLLIYFIRKSMSNAAQHSKMMIKPFQKECAFLAP